MRNILLMATGIFWISAAQAQSIDRQVVAGGGGFVTTGSAGISFTIGETAIQYLSASGTSLSQGFQQGNSNSTSVHTSHPVNATISTYPNPFVHFIEVKSDKTLTNVAFQIADINGKTIPVTSNEMQTGKYWRIQMGEVAAGNYWLTIASGDIQSSFQLTHAAP